MSDRLIVDVGSTHVTWCVGDAYGRALHGGRPGATLVARIDHRPERVIAGSVAAAAVMVEFFRILHERWATKPEMLVATASARGVRNGYRKPETLGVDRWAAMVAAFVRYGGPVVVADCGTALTVDCVDGQGVHRGGFITPGLGLMRESLLRGTRLERLPEPAWGGTGFARDTGQGVDAGCLNALAGALERARAAGVRACGEDGRLLLTGGDAEIARGQLPADWEVAPRLVLEGLVLLAGDEP